MGWAVMIGAVVIMIAVTSIYQIRKIPSRYFRDIGQYS